MTGNFFQGQANNIFRGLTGHYELRPDSTKQFDLTNPYQMDFNFSTGTHDNIQTQILRQVGNALESRTGLLSELNKTRDNELVQTLLNSLVADAFESISDETFMSAEYISGMESPSRIDSEIQKEIDNFIVKQDLTGLSRDIITDWLLQGEYFIRTKCVKGQGVVEIIDDCDTEDYLGLYKGRECDSFLRYNRKVKRYELVDKDELTHFVLDSNRLKVKIELAEDYENLPESVRMGRSVIYPVLNSLRKLNILETTALAMELKRVLAPILISIDVPPDTDTQNVTDIIDRYENYLNDINMDARNSDNLSVSDMLQTASRVKVIPKFADNKGAIEQIRFDFDNTDLNNRINDIRKNIAMAIGVPSFQLSYGDQLLGKADMLKVYAAYARKLVGIQTCFGNGMRNLIYKHLLHKGYFINESNLKIKFKSVTNIDMLDDIEVLVAVLTAIESLTSFFANVSQNEAFGLEVDSEQLLEVYNSFTSSFPKMNGVLKMYKDRGLDKKLKDGNFEIPFGSAPKGGGGGPTKTQFAGSNLSTPTGGSTSTPTPSPKGSEAPPSEAPTPSKPVEAPPTGGSVSIGDTF